VAPDFNSIESLYESLFNNSPSFCELETLLTTVYAGNDTPVDILRLDRLDAEVSGNKVFKLLGHLRQFGQSGRNGLLSFGGRWSNHLHALAYVGKRLGIPTAAMVLGFPEQPLTETLKDCENAGMSLTLCDRKTYAQRYDESWRRSLAEQYDMWVIPEGGEGDAGLVGFQCLNPILSGYDEVWVAAGTGTTALGLAAWMHSSQRLVIVNAVKDQGALQRRLESTSLVPQWRLIEPDGSSGSRFGKASPELIRLITEQDRKGLPLEPVYTANVFAELFRETGREGFCKRLMIHTGGLQGRRGYPDLN